IARAESNAGNIEFLAHMAIEIGAGALACRFALGGFVLDLLGCDELTNRIGEIACKAGIAPRHLAALGLVSREEPRPTPALDRRRELPGEVHHILDRGVVAEPAGRREKMDGVAGHEDAAALIALGDERIPSMPGAAVDDLDRAVGAEHGLEEARAV